MMKSLSQMIKNWLEKRRPKKGGITAAIKWQNKIQAEIKKGIE